MRELDVMYPIHRDELLRRLNKQMLMMELGFDGEDYKGKKRGRKITKPNKYVETKPNYKMYASGRRYY